MVSVVAFSQATTLEVDCQNPGWLSSKINYGDQRTIVNLKVTGYINNDDLKFIGKLMGEYSLNGKLDLSDVYIVGATTSQDNLLNNSNKLLRGSISYLSLPLSLDSAYYACNDLTIDTLEYGGAGTKYIMPNTFKYKKVKNIILREGVENILENTFQKSTNDFCGITLPSTLKTIGNKAFENCYKLANIELPNNLVSIGEYAFANDSVAFGDTLRLPEKLEKLDFSSFSCGEIAHVIFPYDKFEYRYTLLNNHVVYIPKSVQSIIMLGETDITNIVWHMEATTPPELSFSSWSYTYVDYAKQSITVYVPESSVETYKNAPVWNELTILAELIPVSGIELNYDSYTLKGIGDLVQLEATVTPEDASNKDVNWRSSNENICFVSNGKVVAVGYGTCVIIATTADGGYMATCTISVEDTSGISTINNTPNGSYRVYTLDGKESSLKTKGFKIVKFTNGLVQKVCVK